MYYNPLRDVHLLLYSYFYLLYFIYNFHNLIFYACNFCLHGAPTKTISPQGSIRFSDSDSDFLTWKYQYSFSLIITTRPVFIVCLKLLPLLSGGASIFKARRSTHRPLTLHGDTAGSRGTCSLLLLWASTHTRTRTRTHTHTHTHTHTYYIYLLHRVS